MKRINFKIPPANLLHFLFWMISINVWNFVFNPAVQTSSAIKGMYDDAGFALVLACCLLMVYCLLPFSWLHRKMSFKAKIFASFLFILISILLLFPQLMPTKTEDLFREIGSFLIHGFLYVVVFHITIAAAVYFNLQNLIPKYLSKNKFGYYLLNFTGLILIATAANYALFDFVIDPIFPEIFYISYFRIGELVLIIAIYLVFTTLAFLVRQYVILLIEKSEQTQSELSALKAQINPHFLFNNLNTIYSLASKNDKHTKEVVLQLSDFLRYVLYDTASETISLKKEVEIVRTYVNLQKERVHQNLTPIIFTVEGNLENAVISPLLLLPLAENCFKHGIGKNPGKISIHIQYDGKQLLFESENLIVRREKTEKNENSGIGTSNVAKRLDMLYPGKHSLQFEEENGVFYVKMSIILKKFVTMELQNELNVVH